jgi:hypothetical protein
LRNSDERPVQLVDRSQDQLLGLTVYADSGGAKKPADKQLIHMHDQAAQQMRKTDLTPESNETSCSHISARQARNPEASEPHANRYDGAARDFAPDQRPVPPIIQCKPDGDNDTDDARREPNQGQLALTHLPTQKSFVLNRKAVPDEHQ